MDVEYGQHSVILLAEGSSATRQPSPHEDCRHRTPSRHHIDDVCPEAPYRSVRYECGTNAVAASRASAAKNCCGASSRKCALTRRTQGTRSGSFKTAAQNGNSGRTRDKCPCAEIAPLASEASAKMQSHAENAGVATTKRGGRQTQQRWQKR